MLILSSILLCLSPAPLHQDSTGSLEGFLGRAQAAQVAELEALAPQLAPLLEQLGSKKGFSSKKAKLRSAILALGPAVAPLLVPEIEVDIAKGTQSLQRAIDVTSLLVELKPAGVNRQLFQLASGASMRGRMHAIEVLGHVSNPLGVDSFLIELYRKGAAELKGSCINSLALRGGKRSLSVLREALRDSDAEIRRSVLHALAVARDVEAAPAILDAVTVPAAAVSMVAELIEYYRAVPQIVNEDALRALGRLAIETSASRSDCVPILRLLPEFAVARKTRDLRRILDPLQTSGIPEIRDSALTCLYLLGDRQAKKDLMRPYNQGVKDDPRFSTVYIERGEVLLSIKEYNDAAKDFKQALDLINSNRSPAFKKSMINLARAQALAGKLSRARDTLRDASLTPSDRKKLRLDPSFKELLASPRYGKVLS